MDLLVYYLIGVNIIGFFAMAIDKNKARKNLWRIPERTLFIIAIIGGSLGSYFGMQIFRHKTKHNSFVYGIPIIFILQVIILFIFYRYI
ncbi:MAG: DUF1294 domain-containing protein [Clostridiales bacterium]|nr:DUF1294 domain-containing protein [Clostridiales bacterium]